MPLRSFNAPHKRENFPNAGNHLPSYEEVIKIAQIGKPIAFSEPAFHSAIEQRLQNNGTVSSAPYNNTPRTQVLWNNPQISNSLQRPVIVRDQHYWARYKERPDLSESRAYEIAQQESSIVFHIIGYVTLIVIILVLILVIVKLVQLFMNSQ